MFCSGEVWDSQVRFPVFDDGITICGKIGDHLALVIVRRKIAAAQLVKPAQRAYTVDAGEPSVIRHQRRVELLQGRPSVAVVLARLPARTAEVFAFLRR